MQCLPLRIGPCVSHKLYLTPVSLKECIKLGFCLEKELYTSTASEMRGTTVVLLALLTRALNPCCRSFNPRDDERQSEHSENRAVKDKKTLTCTSRYVPLACDG